MLETSEPFRSMLGVSQQGEAEEQNNGGEKGPGCWSPTPTWSSQDLFLFPARKAVQQTRLNLRRLSRTSGLSEEGWEALGR